MFYVPDGEGMYTRGSSSTAVFLMGQSLFIIAQLLTAGLLHVNELDPIRRYLPSYNRPRKGGSRYSAFQASILITCENQNRKKHDIKLGTQFFTHTFL
jgi:phosphorylase kinase alpha/beta subunit